VIRRVLSACAFISLLLAAGASLAHPKLDPYLESFPGRDEFKALSISVVPPSESSEEEEEEDEAGLVDVFIKASDPQSVAELVRSHGGSVGVVTGEIVTARVPAGSIESIADSSDVVFIEAAKPISVRNDIATPEIGATEVMQGLGLPQGYTGAGIVIGIVDTGIDYTHPDLKNSDGASRVAYIWDQGRSGGVVPSEIDDAYGSECDGESISSGSCILMDVDGHGTHVAGIAASSDDTYMGVAPDASIVAVKYDARLDLESGYADTIFSTKICEAAYYVFAKAAQMGMPAVVNLSLGTHIGSHDGKSLFEQCLSSLVEGQAGRALVAAAGNEYSGDRSYTGIHARFDPEGATKATNFVIRTVTSDRIYYIDFWGDAESDLSVGLAMHDGEPEGDPLQRSYMARRGDKISGSFLGGDVRYMINSTEVESPLNGKHHVGIRIMLDSDFPNPASYSFDLVVGGSGGFDAWLFPDKPARTIQFTSVDGDVRGDYEYVAGDREMSIAIPATSPGVIAVAGYATRTRWNAESLSWIFSGQELGSILNFSSSGPTADPSATGQKPEITAPGGMIASALSSNAAVSAQVLTGDGEHFMQAGTSMAAPYVSGTIALMFQHNPNFTQDDVEGFLIDGAYVDSYVGGVPNDRWGYGKLDVLSSMELAVNGVASGSFDAQGAISAPSGQETGKSSCQLAAGAPCGAQALHLAFMLLAAIGLAARRARA